MKTCLSALLLLFSCTARPVAMTATPVQLVVVHGAPRLVAGDAVEGRQMFAKLRCDICHSVAGSPARAPHPLRDLSTQPPDAIAAMIVQRTDVAPGAMFDEMAMASAASRMTPQDLAHLVAYLREPRKDR
ncbi:MAG: c-type cytochrome [Thermoanaerobaculia bacterium]